VTHRDAFRSRYLLVDGLLLMTAKTPKTETTPGETEQAHRRRIITRLARVEGQIRGVQGMIGDNCSCEDVAQQLTAARRALDKAFYEMLACSLVSHIDASGSMQDVRDSTDELARLLAKFG
jgi:CsoR family transcriptional regulator, copper-sensing transcriptional repressor